MDEIGISLDELDKDKLRSRHRAREAKRLQMRQSSMDLEKMRWARDGWKMPSQSCGSRRTTTSARGCRARQGKGRASARLRESRRHFRSVSDEGAPE